MKTQHRFVLVVLEILFRTRRRFEQYFVFLLQAPGRHTTVTYGGQVFEITTVSTNMIVVRYKILYYEIITLIKNVQENMAQIKDSPPSNTTAVMLKVRDSSFLHCCSLCSY